MKDFLNHIKLEIMRDKTSHKFGILFCSISFALLFPFEVLYGIGINIIWNTVYHNSLSTPQWIDFIWQFGSIVSAFIVSWKISTRFGNKRGWFDHDTRDGHKVIPPPNAGRN